MKRIYLVLGLLLTSSATFAWKPFVEVNGGMGVVPDSKLSEYSFGYGNADGGRAVVSKPLYNTETSYGGSLGVGVMLNNYFGVQAQYTMLSGIDSDGTYAFGPEGAPTAIGTFSETTTASASALALVLDVPLPQNKNFFVTGKAGVAYVDISRDIKETVKYTSGSEKDVPLDRTESSKGLGVTLGMGMGYHLTRNFDIQSTYNYLGRVQDGQNIQFAAVGASYRF